jgi:hypothetical protein
MDTRTIRRWEGASGTWFEIEVTGPDGEAVYSDNFKHDDAVEALRDEWGVQDAGMVVYNAAQSSHPYEF